MSHLENILKTITPEDSLAKANEVLRSPSRTLEMQMVLLGTAGELAATGQGDHSATLRDAARILEIIRVRLKAKSKP